MKKTFALAILTAAIGGTSAFALEPIQGSIGYNGSTASRLEKAPVGSTFSHSFSANGERYDEVYIVGTDHTLKLVDRSVSSDD